MLSTPAECLDTVTDCFETARDDAASPNMLVTSQERGDELLDFAASVAESLSERPRHLECRFLYDARGSALYEEITRLPEYYPTRTEAAILERHARDIAALTGPVTLVELGAGTSVKTDHLLSAYQTWKPEVTYVPIDVSRSALRRGMDAIARRRPGVQVVGINGTYEHAFPVLAAAAPNLVVFLGSTLGNLDPEAEHAFWSRMRHALAPGDFVLLGVDLVKDVPTLWAAYNDAAGVTAAFTTNLFTRMNRELDAGLDVSAIRHEARWNSFANQIEIDARFLRAQTLRVTPLDRVFDLQAGETVRVEISRKFRVEPLKRTLRDHGLHTVRVFTDPRRWFALFLLQRSA